MPLDLATLQAVKRWIDEAPGPEPNAYYHVEDKVDAAIEEITQPLKPAVKGILERVEKLERSMQTLTNNVNKLLVAELRRQKRRK